jgi:hypothetical protein
MTDAWIAELNLPALPHSIPQRLDEAIRTRTEALLFQLREAKSAGYVRAFETRLVRDAHRAVLTAVELDVEDARVYYSQFRDLVEQLGYERCDVGFKRVTETG